MKKFKAGACTNNLYDTEEETLQLAGSIAITLLYGNALFLGNGCSGPSTDCMTQKQPETLVLLR